MLDTIKELNDNELGNITGGNFDWQIFAKTFMEGLPEIDLVADDNLKELVQAIKDKRWIDVEILIPRLNLNNQKLIDLISRSLKAAKV